jgi:hypothetical protein
LEEGFVLLDLREVRVISLGRGHPGIEEQLGGKPELREFGTESRLQGDGAIVI